MGFQSAQAPALLPPGQAAMRSPQAGFLPCPSPIPRRSLRSAPRAPIPLTQRRTQMIGAAVLPVNRIDSRFWISSMGLRIRWQKFHTQKKPRVCRNVPGLRERKRVSDYSKTRFFLKSPRVPNSAPTNCQPGLLEIQTNKYHSTISNLYREGQT